MISPRRKATDSLFEALPSKKRHSATYGGMVLSVTAIRTLAHLAGPVAVYRWLMRGLKTDYETEITIFAALRAGASKAAIARKLRISLSTVKRVVARGPRPKVRCSDCGALLVRVDCLFCGSGGAI